MTEIHTATFARIQHYGDGTPDPRTATCEQHRVASPYSGTAKGDGVAIPESDGWPCVVCPLPHADLIGTNVITSTLSGVYVYGGTNADIPDGSVSQRIDLRGGPTVVRCSVGMVAPADTPVNEKDPRIVIVKMPQKRYFHDRGVWLPQIDHPAFRDWTPFGERTKRDAVTGAARRLAIADYHTARAEKRGNK